MTTIGRELAPSTALSKEECQPDGGAEAPLIANMVVECIAGSGLCADWGSSLPRSIT